MKEAGGYIEYLEKYRAVAIAKTTISQVAVILPAMQQGAANELRTIAPGRIYIAWK